MSKREICHKHKRLQTESQPLHKTKVLRTGGFA
jgi:hypothetical protein